MTYRVISEFAIPIWVKQGINVWVTAVGIKHGRLLGRSPRNGKVNRGTLVDWEV